LFALTVGEAEAQSLGDRLQHDQELEITIARPLNAPARVEHSGP
jgi:hypothetical protein